MLTTKHHKIRLELLPGFKGRLLDDIHFNKYGFKGKVPKGYITDGASIPKFLWLLPKKWKIEPFALNTLRGAVIHDFLYNKKRIKRFWCDLIFLATMKESGAPLWKRQLYYWAVVLCGWWPRYVTPFIKKLMKK